MWEDDDVESLAWHGSPRESRRTEDTEQSRRDRENKEIRKADDRERKEEREHRRSDDRVDRDTFRRVPSFGSERVLSSIRGLTMDSRELDRLIFCLYNSFKFFWIPALLYHLSELNYPI